MSDIDTFLDGEPSKPAAKQSTPASQIDTFLSDAPPPARGFGGWARDVAATAVKGAIAVPEAVVGLADIPTGGRVGKFLENEDGAVGFRPKQAKEIVNEWHSDATKEAQRKFQEADGIVDKAATAIQNPSLIATAVGESLPSMGAGGVAARGLMAATRLGQMGAKGAALAGAAGEGIAGAGAAAEQIRQETDDGLLTPGQAAAAAGTGVATAGFGALGGKIANRLGIGDAETMLAQGNQGIAKQFADDASRAATNPLVQQQAVKSIPRQVIEGAVAEGFLEELPQSVAEQVFQNLALDKPWYEDVDAAVVMGTLSGAAMGGAAAGYRGFREPSAPEQQPVQPGQPPQPAPQQPAPNPGLDMVRQSYEAQLQALREQEQGEPIVAQTAPPDGAAALAQQRAQAEAERQAAIEASRAVVSPDDEIYQSTGMDQMTPSQRMGLRSGPESGALESAAALAVDAGATAQLQQAAAQAQAQAQATEAAKKVKPAKKKTAQAAEVDPQTGEIASGMAAWSDADLSTAFRGAQSRDVRLQLAKELQRRRAARAETTSASGTEDAGTTQAITAATTGDSLARQAQTVQAGPLQPQAGGQAPAGRAAAGEASAVPAAASPAGGGGVQADGLSDASTQEQIEAKTDEVMRLVVQTGAGGITRELTRALIQQKGMEAADRTIAALTSSLEKRRRDEADYLAKRQAAEERRAAQQAAPGSADAPTGAGSVQAAAAVTAPPPPASTAKLFTDPRTGTAVVVPNKATADAMARSKQLAGKVAVRKATSAEMADKNNSFTGYSEGDPRRTGYVLEMTDVAQPPAPGPSAPKDKQREAALARVNSPKGAFFMSQPKAQAFIKDNGLADTHELRQQNKAWHVVAKAAAPAAPASASNNLLQAAKDSGKLEILDGPAATDGNARPAPAAAVSGQAEAPFEGMNLPDQVKEYLLTPSVTMKDGSTVSAKDFVDSLLADGYGNPEYFVAPKGSQVGFLSKPGSPRETLNAKQMLYADAAFMAKKRMQKKQEQAAPSPSPAPEQVPASDAGKADTIANTADEVGDMPEVAAGLRKKPSKEDATAATVRRVEQVLRQAEKAAAINSKKDAPYVATSSRVAKEAKPSENRFVVKDDITGSRVEWQALSPAGDWTVQTTFDNMEAATEAVASLGIDPASVSVWDSAWNAKAKRFTPAKKREFDGQGSEPQLQAAPAAEAATDVEQQSAIERHGLPEGTTFSSGKGMASGKWIARAGDTQGNMAATIDEAASSLAQFLQLEKRREENTAAMVALSKKVADKLKRGEQPTDVELRDLFGLDPRHTYVKQSAVGQFLVDYMGVSRNKIRASLGAAAGDVISDGGVKYPVVYPRKLHQVFGKAPAIAQMEPVDSLHNPGKPDPKNSAAMDELDGFKPGDSVDVNGRTIGRSTVELVYRRQMAGLGVVPMARVVDANGKKIDVLLSELTRIDQKPEAPAQANPAQEKQVSAAAPAPADGAAQAQNQDAGNMQPPASAQKPVAKKKPSADQVRAQADLMSALADLGDILGKNARMNIVPEQEQKLLPVLTRVLDAAFRLGYHKFKDSAKFALDQIREHLGADAADALTLDHLQGAYIAMAGGKQGADTKRAVIDVESKAEIEAHEAAIATEKAETDNDTNAPGADATTKEPNSATTVPTGELPAERQERAGDDAATGNRNSEPLDDGLAGSRQGADRGERVPAGTAGAGGSRADGVQQSGQSAPGTARDSGTLRSEQQPADPVADPATAETSPKPELDQPADFNLAGEDIGKGGLTKKYRDNIAAIRILKAMESENRVATPEERKQIARYVGWGALKGVFDPQNKQWSKEYAELKELLTDAEYKAARASTLNAHYTSPTVVGGIFEALDQLGFTKGRVLEPSVGTGNFFGLMPAKVRKASQLHGVELDPLTSQIAAALYPSAKIAKATGFQDFQVPAEYFDLAIGNPPFGSEPLVDDDRSPYSGASIHNYFFAKSIDKLRPGGLLAMVVSHNFLDAKNDTTRRWIAERANLVSAVRLPRTAFKENAGTDVVTDILIFQKKTESERVNGLGDASWVNTTEVRLTNPKTGEESTHRISSYFEQNPSNVLGTPTAGGSMYRANEYTVEPLERSLEDSLTGWVIGLPQGIYQAVERTHEPEAADVAVPDGIKVGSYFVADDGSVQIRGNDVMGNRTASAWTAPNAKAAERMKGMIGLRDALRAQMRLEKSHDATEDQIEAHRRDLNAKYDAFQKSYGYLNDPTNRRIFLDDTESALLLALEFDYDKGVSKAVAEKEDIEARAPSAVKADIFKRRVMFPPADNIKVSSAKDALLASLNYKGRLDLDYMASLYDKPQADIVSELGDVVFNDPINGMVMSDEYLSGDVKTKLAEAEAAARDNPVYKRNVDALKKVIPADKRPSEIHAALGAPFIPAELFEQFAKEVTGATVKMAYIKATGQWIVDQRSEANATLNVGKWGIGKMPATTILARTMAGQGVVVTETRRNPDGSTTTVVLERETEAAREKQAAMKAEWQRWLWADADRADMVAGIYNEKMNRIVPRKYDGSHMTFPGMSPAIELLPHQKNAVWRALQSRQVLLDHVVGAGKTFEVVALFMEMRRLGIARKPFIAVPNHLTLQWRSEFSRLYPAANVLAATPDDFAKGNREKFFSKIITGDWDAVIVGHSSLKKIALPADTERAVLEEQITEIASAIEDMKRARGDRNIIRDMEGIKARLEARMKQRLQALGERDKVVTFDELGVDAFAVDELHEFKNLFYNSTMERVPGMGNPAGSDKAFDLFVKLQWMFDTFGDKAPITGATGTPVSNSLVEMFNMQRFLQYPTLKREGLHVFDAWAKQFGSVESVYEVSPSGTGYRQSSRFAKFKNLPALMAHYQTFADTVTLDDLKAQEEARGKAFPVPKVAGGRPVNVVAKRSPQVASFMGVPELDMKDGAVQFGFNVARGDEAIIEQNSDGTAWSVQVRSTNEDGQPITMHLGSAKTEEDARLMLVEAALSPKIKVDPESILGKFGRLRELNKETKGKVNALSLTGQANKAGLDYRLIDPSAPDFAGSKINLAVDRMMSIYHQWAADRGTQLVFCDLSVPLSSRSGFGAKERRIYVRDNWAITHKRGTMHTVAGHEDLPFFLVKEGAKDAKSFVIYDAATGLRVHSGLPSKTVAIEWAGRILADDAKRQRWIDARDNLGDITQDEIDDYNNANEIDTEEAEAISLADIAGVSGATGFSVYDDIKAKLIAKGVPEREIAFIHDYGTPAAKDKLFKAVDNGSIRFLLGSTPKMGAGTNVQKRLVGLHHIDAPWRPSDLEQREGRIIRRGNELYERDPQGFEVAIFRYATEQTYDTRRWQILEHKARGIEQLRKYDGTLNEIDDIEGEAANAADMKAAASGDPLILEETQLRNEVRRLEALQASHADESQAMVRRARDQARFANEWGPRDLAKFEQLKKDTDAHPVKKDEFAGLAVDGGKLIGSRDEAVKAIKRAMDGVLGTEEGGSATFTYRGIEFSLTGNASYAELESPTGQLDSFRMQSQPMPSAAGFLTRFANYVNRLPAHIDDLKAKIAEAAKAAKELREQSGKPFAQAEELAAAREAHKRVQRRLIAKGPDIPATQRPLLEQAMEQQKEALREQGFDESLDEDAAPFGARQRPATGTPTDRAVMDMVREGRGARDILRLIAGTSKSRFNRQVARLLLKTGIDPQVLLAHGAMGGKDGFTFLAKYSRKNNAISLTEGAQAQAEQIILHEMVHAATLAALDRKGLHSLQMRRLFEHVKRRGGAAGQYGMKNVGEFVSEVFTNPEFQRALKAMDAPAGGTIRNAWDGFVRILRSILGLPQSEHSALSRALELGVAVMREDMQLRQRGVVARGGDAQAGIDQTQTEAFKRWFGDDGVRNADGKPQVFYHGGASDFTGIRPGGRFDGAIFVREGAESGYGEKQHALYLNSPILELDEMRDLLSDNPQVLANVLGGNVDTDVLDMVAESLTDGSDYPDSQEVWDAIGAIDEADAQLEMQKLRGRVARALGFKAVRTPDEFGGETVMVLDASAVKSAADNNGNFDPEDPDIAHFGAADLNRVKASALDQLHQTLSHPGKVSLWDKTVGTMRNLAERAPAFKPVFESAQRFIDDVATLANEAADAAPRLLPRVDSWRDLNKKPISAADNKALARPLFEGTLSWARDVDGKPVTTEALNDKYRNEKADRKAQIMLATGKIQEGVLKMWRGLPLEQYETLINSRFESTILKPGVVWSAKELQSMFGLNDQQVGLYQEARAAVDRSIDITARADMLRVLGEAYAGMRDAVMEAGTLDDAMALLTETLQQEARDNPDSAARVLALNNEVVKRHEKAKELMAYGYAPLSRFGRYTVDVVDQAGERQYFGMFESMREANLMKMKMASVYPGATVTQGTMSQEAFKLFAGITPESLEQFGEMLGLRGDGNEAKDKAFQAYLQLAKNNHSALKRLIHRKGIDGYSEDVGRVLASFVYSNARLGAGALNAGTMENAIEAIPKEQGELRDVAMALRSYIQDPQEEGQAVRGMLFAQYLGGSVASAFVNMTQPFAVTMPWLSQFGGMKKAGAQLARALKDMARAGTDKGFRYEADLANALKHAEDDGVVSPQEIHQLMAQARGTGSLRVGDGTKMGDARAAASNAWERTKVAWGQPFALAEQFNRRSTFIAAFRMAKEQGRKNPAEFARKAVLETQFLYSKANKGRFMRGAIGGTLMTFKTYSVSYLELLHRMWTQGGPEGKRAVGWAMAMLLLMGGAGGLPFMEDAEDLIDGIAQLMGYNVSAKQWRKQALRDIVGKELADFVEQGVSGLPGAPVDVSGRLGMGNLIPGTGLLLSKQNRERDLLEIAGPAGDLVARGFSGGRKLLTGDVAGAALEVSPTAVRNAAKGIDMATSGIYKDTKGYKVIDTTLDEALAKFAGFQPKSVAEVQEANSFMQRSKSFYIQTSSEIKAQWAKALFDKDDAALQRVRARLDAWNRDNPDQRIVVKMPDVWKRVREMGKDRTQRIAETAPKALRQQMRDMAREAG